MTSSIKFNSLVAKTVNLVKQGGPSFFTSFRLDDVKLAARSTTLLKSFGFNDHSFSPDFISLTSRDNQSSFCQNLILFGCRLELSSCCVRQNGALDRMVAKETQTTSELESRLSFEFGNKSS